MGHIVSCATFISPRPLFSPIETDDHYLEDLKEFRRKKLFFKLDCRNYTIELEFLSYLDAENPRSSIVAGDPKEGPYAYSGQSFAACKYTNCPIHANLASTYVYHFQTLASDFNYLTLNVTNDFFGPSLFCAGTPINFQQQP
ncbi:hypothetical protein PtB15_14B363 [Puccinia triticina]|nr:hypothetical protein PtB15_14B363 [Puccinia triticina]